MTCPTCGHENQPDAHFCASCGSPLEVTCPSCGRANPRGTRYCASCGLQLTDAAGVVEGHPPEPPESPDRIPPRDVGELIGETFRVYRQSFWPFALIALIPQAPSVASVLAGLDSVPFILVLGLVGVFLSILAGGASVSAVVDQHLGRPIDVWGCYKRAWNRVLSLVVVFLVVSLALAGSGLLMIIIVGIPLFFWLLVVRFYATEAIIIEGEDPISALGRSYGLVKGTWWRVFGIGVVFVLVIIALSIAGVIPVIVISLISPVTGALLSAVVSSLILPVLFIGRTLVYFDLRSRKERYTLGVLASEVGCQS